MTGKEAFCIFAPKGAKWVDWVRPVPFLFSQGEEKRYQSQNLPVPLGYYIEKEMEHTATIVDLPGVESVREGMALAHKGLRPIPIYNGTNGQTGSRTTVDNQCIGNALCTCAEELKTLEISRDALPVFLLDSNRLHRYKMDVTLFDNSWDVYAQDLPTAEYFLKQGIQTILVVGKFPAKDLKKILYEYQKKGLLIFYTDRYEKPKKIKIRKPFLKEKNG